MSDFIRWKRQVSKAPQMPKKDGSGSSEDSEGAGLDMPPLENAMP